MFLNSFRNKLIRSAVFAVCICGFSGCSLVNEDLDECPANLSIRFVYDYNLKFSNAFPHEVKSVYVWAFDESGAFVWSGSASGEALKYEDFKIETPLSGGTYDFVSWCGLQNNKDFDLATYTPASKEELEVKLKTTETAGAYVSQSHLPGLYHGILANETYTVDANKPSIQTITIPLMKDTNDIRVLLQKYDGSKIEESDFEVFMTIPDAWLAWNNSVMPEGPMVTYRPWEIQEGTASVGEDPEEGTITSISSLLYDFSSSRLLADAKATLTVRRTADNKDIIRVPIIEYFLMVKGHYENADGTPLTDQQYLDRQDDYSILFFIDEKNEWYLGFGIYINSWAVVPPQHSVF